MTPTIPTPSLPAKARRVQGMSRREARAALRASKIERPRSTKAERRVEHKLEMQMRRARQLAPLYGSR